MTEVWPLSCASQWGAGTGLKENKVGSFFYTWLSLFSSLFLVPVSDWNYLAIETHARWYFVRPPQLLASSSAIPRVRSCLSVSSSLPIQTRSLPPSGGRWTIYLSSQLFSHVTGWNEMSAPEWPISDSSHRPLSSSSSPFSLSNMCILPPNEHVLVNKRL